MRLFFIEWTGKECGLVDVVRQIKNRDHEIVYWSGLNVESLIDKSEFSNTIFHDYHDARAGKPSPQVDSSFFEPPSEELIRSMYETESTLLVMMNKAHEWMGENEKKHLYYTYLQYWDGVIKKYKPDAIIGPSAPHTLYDLVLFDLAKMHGIKTIMFEQTSVFDRAIILNDYKKSCEALEKQLLEDKDKIFSVEDFEADIRRYYDKQMDSLKPHIPQYIHDLNKRFSFFNILKTKSTVLFRSFRDGVFFERVGNKLLRFNKGNLKKEHERVQTSVDFDKKYIYMPLHYQPECSTCPLGGVFVDQILAIKILSFCLPKDWLIYVKEHPTQWKFRGPVYFAYRYRGYYEEITKLKNVRLVPLNTDSFELIKKSQAVATIGGTASWEGLFYGKPGIVFGYPWYKHCKGIFRVNDAASCQAVMDKIEKGYKVNPQDLINYLGSFQKVVLSAFREEYYKKISPNNVEQNINNMVKILSRELSE